MLPLDNIRVLELTTAWAGPMAGRVLAYLGADVTHVESPTRTNTWRMNKGNPSGVNYPDFDPGERRWDRAFLFNSQNVNKRSLAIDIKTGDGLEAVRGLIMKSDVLICNFRPGMLQRLDLDYDTLSRTRPDIIVAEMPAFGLEGPHSSYAALGPTMEMAAGMSAMIAYKDGKPTVTGPSYLDPIGGFNAAAAILTALLHRQATGEGQHIEVAQVEAAMQFIGPEILAAAAHGRDALADGNRVDFAAPHGAYPARGEDEWIAIAAEDEEQWRALCRVMGDEEFATDARFATLAARKQNEDALDSLIASWTKGLDKRDLAGRLQAAGVIAAPVNTPRDIAASEYLACRGFFAELDHPVAGQHPHPGLPFHLSRTPGAYRSAAPGFGADNTHLLREVLGLPAEKVAEMEKTRVIATAPDAEA
ncbi:CoA transferase [Chelativorans sp. AA-79]|uniref:CaiB/BaiF CoA transferase family protein n=1 Tax=Chelativorans sp. AA-79 TaxID=3028735 RepID=UPI0023F76F8B|nr:CoA transferase [Chelativorans sp. AA-79]WEX12015.1 CoA transferase [Chelativorans sp. AA-79]